MEDEHLGIGRLCPHCGVRADTLGSACPACGKPYAPRGGLLDRVPVPGDVLESSVYGVRLMFLAWIALIGLAIWFLIKQPVTGILVLAVAFVVLVAAIGVANALTDRGH